MPASPELVADVYLSALEKGEMPSRAVELRWGISRMTAGRWVRKAKEAGLIPADAYSYKPNRRVVAVARAVGVEPEVLHRAIVKHADGWIRLVN